MSVEDPGFLTVTCDECGETANMDTTCYAGDLPSFGVEEQTLKDNDWTVVGGGTFCP